MNKREILRQVNDEIIFADGFDDALKGAYIGENTPVFLIRVEDVRF